MAEGWLRHHAETWALAADIHSAGTEATRVKPEATEVMREIGIDLSQHHSKALWDVTDPWNFDYVLTVCDAANETCPAYPASTTRLHVGFRDPSGSGLETWRTVRDEIGSTCESLIKLIAAGKPVMENDLQLPD